MVVAAMVMLRQKAGSSVRVDVAGDEVASPAPPRTPPHHGKNK